MDLLCLFINDFFKKYLHQIDKNKKLIISILCQHADALSSSKPDIYQNPCWGNFV